MTGSEPRIEPATTEDLPALTELLMDLLTEEQDFTPDRAKQEEGLRLVLENPNRGRIFVVRTDDQIIGMVNVLFTLSTAAGGSVVNMEDVIIHPDHRRHGYGSMLVQHVIEFAKAKSFLRITLLTDQISDASQKFFAKHGFIHSKMIPMRQMLDNDS